MNPNFIIIRLCDNDYGQELEQAAQLLHDNFGGEDLLVSEPRVKRIVIDLVCALMDLGDAARGFETENSDRRRTYLSKMRVEFAEHAPTDDHDGGSVAIDRNRSYIWRF